MLKVGSLHGAYRIVRRLGAGAMGEVYEAEHTGLGKRVALKVMLGGDDHHDDRVARFVREGRAAAAIRHEHVVDVSDVGVIDEIPFLVMELLDGEPLAALLTREAPLSPERCAGLVLPIVSALAAAHDTGLLHRDVKPENIFLARDRRGEVVPKLLDFGLSHVGGMDPDCQRLTGSRSIVGTPAYLAPEVVLHGRDVSPASDQYALGVVLFECATGQLPFRESSLFGLLSAILRAKAAKPSALHPGVDPRLEAVILKAMQKEPGDRYADLRALGRALLPLASPAAREHWSTEFVHAPKGLRSATVRVPMLSLATAPKGRWAVGFGMAAALTVVGTAWAARHFHSTRANPLRHSPPTLAATASPSPLPSPVVPSAPVTAVVVPTGVPVAPTAPTTEVVTEPVVAPVVVRRPLARAPLRPAVRPAAAVVAAPPTAPAVATSAPSTPAPWSLRTHF